MMAEISSPASDAPHDDLAGARAIFHAFFGCIIFYALVWWLVA